jgi:hypothetical protein
METVRFSQVVAKCGEPQAHVQWLPVAQDAELKAAMEDERVMTVHIQTVGTKKDFGEIGLETKGQRTLLIFPKTLRRFAGKRVVGIDYGLLKGDAGEEEPEVKRVNASKVKAKPGVKRVRLRLVKKPKVKAEREPRVKAEVKVRSKVKAKTESKRNSEAKPKLKLVKRPEVEVKVAKPAAAKVAAVPAKKAVKAAPAKVKEASKKKKSAGEADLRAVIRKAMKQLGQGKDVAAYQTLLGGLEG